MLKIKITDQIKQSAQKRADLFVGPNKFKIKKGTEIYGMVGEELFLASFGGKLINNNNYDIDHPLIGKIDIKTKSCSSDPKENYDCTVAAYQMDKKECEFYVFYRVDTKLEYAWYCGILSVKDFKEKSVLKKKGEREGPYVYSVDCYNVKIHELYNIDKYIKV